MDGCQVDGCTKTVSKAGHPFCRDHWKAERDGTVKQCTACQRWHENAGPLCRACGEPSARSPVGSAADDDESPDSDPRGLLSSTRIGKHFGLSNIKTNLILAELGWIEKYANGWAPTERGTALGANVKSGKNAPFVVWPESILKNIALRDSVTEQSAEVESSPAVSARPSAPPADKYADCRPPFPATLRTQDGHMVRSRAEVLIDNWLYMQGIVHAYERRLPIEENCLCDFYLPAGKGVYIEYWGRDFDPKYRERKAVKQAIYAKYKLRLIELGDAEIERLDDVLPRMLLRFGIESA
ncbi:MAG: hypothetical protein QOF78_4612 [Phycisphaerales bacterium]|jgi:hypothetical protein|nr:hypothetical protein [Phycisphaerales bacterium]